jgi:uncharacterized protein YndB with AHSA1/START domain
MQQITGSKKYPDGIRVFWSDAGHKTSEFFSFDDLVDQKINALDILNNPRLYRVNTTSHQIESSVAGCSLNTGTCGGDLVITRFFDAPRDLVWKAWTDPAFVMRWWGPKNFTSPSCRADLRVSGSYLYCMRSPEGKEIWSGGVFREIHKPEKIVCTAGFTDEQGNPVPAATYGMSPDFPAEMLMTVTFEVQAGRTRLTLRYAGIPAGDSLDMARAGWNESLDKFAAVVGQAVFGKGT